VQTFGPDELRDALARHERTWLPPCPGRRNHIPASVLVPIGFAPDPHVYVTLRPSHLREHGGEFCFPGGRREPDDTSLEETALREAHEELALEQVSLLGELSTVPLYTSDYRLFPFVGWIIPDEICASPDEVASVDAIAVQELFNRPAIDAISYTSEGKTHLSPVFMVGEKPLFGATAHVLYELLGVLSSVVGASVPSLVTGRFTFRDLLGRPSARET